MTELKVEPKSRVKDAVREYFALQAEYKAKMKVVQDASDSAFATKAKIKDKEKELVGYVSASAPSNFTENIADPKERVVEVDGKYYIISEMPVQVQDADKRLGTTSCYVRELKFIR